MTDFVIEIYDEDGQTLRAISRLLDISVSGACVDSTSDLMENDRFVIRLLLNPRQRVSVPVRVVWKRSFAKTHQYGLTFSDYPAETRRLIEAFVVGYAAKLKKMGPKIIYTDNGVQEV